MAVVSLPSTVTADSAATLRQGTAGVAIAAGEVVYLNSVTGRYALADADASLAAANVIGIALNNAAVGQPLTLLTEGTLLGCTGLKAGKHYLLANVPGDIAESDADLTEDVSYSTYIGVALNTTTLRVKINVSGALVNLV